MSKKQVNGNPSCIFIELPFRWILHEIDDNGMAEPQGKLNGENVKKNLIKITGRTEEEAIKKLGKLLKRYQDFVNDLGKLNEK